MRIYLIRHGEAKPKHEDPDRALTDRGQAESRKIADFLTPLNLAVSAVWHSGKTRAAQTAEILATAVASENAPAARRGLAPLDDVQPLAGELDHATADHMIVGHLPFLARLAGALLTGNADACPVAFQCSTAVCLERDNTIWYLRWALPPNLLPPA